MVSDPNTQNSEQQQTTARAFTISSFQAFALGSAIIPDVILDYDSFERSLAFCVPQKNSPYQTVIKSGKVKYAIRTNRQDKQEGKRGLQESCVECQTIQLFTGQRDGSVSRVELCCDTIKSITQTLAHQCHEEVSHTDNRAKKTRTKIVHHFIFFKVHNTKPLTWSNSLKQSPCLSKTDLINATQYKSRVHLSSTWKLS